MLDSLRIHTAHLCDLILTVKHSSDCHEDENESESAFAPSSALTTTIRVYICRPRLPSTTLSVNTNLERTCLLCLQAYNSNDSLDRQSVRIAQKNCTVLTLKALERAINVSLPHTRKLRSSATMDNNPDTQRIGACLDNCGTPQEIAEEGFRVCRVNADLRAEVCCHYTKYM